MYEESRTRPKPMSSLQPWCVCVQEIATHTFMHAAGLCVQFGLLAACEGTCDRATCTVRLVSGSGADQVPAWNMRSLTALCQDLRCVQTCPSGQKIDLVST